MNHSTHTSAPIRLHALVSLAAVIAIVALLATGCGATANGDVSLEVPDMTIDTYQGAAVLGGEQVRLSDVVAQGKPVVLNFYAALCPPCRAEMPDFERIYAERSADFTMIGVDIGPQQFLGSREEGEALLAELDITYPAGTTFDQNIVREYLVVAMPTTIFIRTDGSVARTWSGLLNEARINEFVDEIVEG